MLYHTIDTCDLIYLRIFSNLFKKHIFCEKNVFFILKNKPSQTKIIPFSERTLMLGRTFFLVLLALVVNI